METVYDVMQFLKRFGTFIYTKNRVGDLQLMEIDLMELYKGGLIEAREFQSARHILRTEEIRLENEIAKKDQ
ncbi:MULTISPECIES: YqgQ family protein [Rummeliibacillus]|uniref:YqgQ family protein n=1 Tax=Rummeliibacillus TaxID=648802 RepID=UPI0016464830|nr:MULTISPECIES: YqgQ family protein [Rummeliibacillus]MBO2534996.1 YqgQ family protein [Rummeliibacillus suwonensis]